MPHYGWIPDRPDQRDHLYTLYKQHLPPVMDLRALCPRVYDQGDLGSCTANALAGAVQFDELKEGIASETPSRLFIYYNERKIEHSVSSDSGAMIRDGIKTLAKQGACTETLWPYDISQFATVPPQTCYQSAHMHLISSYQRLSHSQIQMKSCLASGYPFVAGFTVYESFESAAVASTGVVPMPGPDESVLGGHAVLVVGYDDSQQRFIVRNSWGSSWGMAGYFTMPYTYLQSASLASDFWTIRFTQ